MNARAGAPAHRAAWLALQGLSERDVSTLRAGMLPPAAERWVRRATLYTRMYAALSLFGAAALTVVAVLDGSIAIASVAGHPLGIEIVGAAVAVVVGGVLLARSFAPGNGSRVSMIEGPAHPGSRTSGDADERTLTIDGVVHGGSSHPLVSVLQGAVAPGMRVRAYLAGDRRILVAVEPLG